MSYIAKLNNITFFDTDIDNEKYKLTSAQITGSKSFTFTLPLVNAFHGQFNKIIDFVEVYKKDKQIFAGRVYSLNDAMDKSQKVVCEHMSAILYDSVHRPVTYENMTNIEVFESLIDNHNGQVENAKKLERGRITITSAACYRAYEKIEKTAKRINDLVETYGGHLAFRREYTENGPVNYIDWLKEYDEGCNQTIRFGKNILDIKKESNAASIITALIPYGATDDEGNVLDIRTEDSDPDYITAPQEVINKYGLIFDTVTFDDITNKENLISKARAYLEAAYTEKITINVTAVDLADAGYDVESFHVGQSLHVISEPHGIDDWFDCKEQSLNLLNPANNRLTLGNTVSSFIEIQRKQVEKINDDASKQKTALQKAVDRATNLITGNKGGYVVLHDSDEDGYPDEILIMDTPSIENAVQVWRWNKEGLGFSDEGYDGGENGYKTAITQDGQIVASFITAGELNADIIKTGILKSQEGNEPSFYLDLNSGELKITGGYIDIKTSDEKDDRIKLAAANGNYTYTSPYCYISSNPDNNKETQLNAGGIITRFNESNIVYCGIVGNSSGNNGGAIYLGKEGETDTIVISALKESIKIGDNYIEDYIIHYGKDGEWYYREWKSGLYECWRAVVVDTLSIREAWGSMYSGEIGFFQFPREFSGTPNLQASILGGTGAWMLSASNSSYTTITTPTYYAIRPVAATISLGITISAIGFLKKTEEGE